MPASDKVCFAIMQKGQVVLENTTTLWLLIAFSTKLRAARAAAMIQKRFHSYYDLFPTIFVVQLLLSYGLFVVAILKFYPANVARICGYQVFSVSVWKIIIIGNILRASQSVQSKQTLTTTSTH